MRDEVFKKPIKKQFEFDRGVASVFDDMIARSVPYYDVAGDLACEFLAKFSPKNAQIYDLGCSTASFLIKLARLRSDLSLVGIDESPAMIELARDKAGALGLGLDLRLGDVLQAEFKGADAVILNYTLQFIRPIKRGELVGRIHASLRDSGVLIFSEKLIYEDKELTKNLIEIYENYKEKQGYSRFEIAQKRKALENVLVPYTQKENEQMCLNSGFARVECIFKWANFATFVAFKK